MYIYKERVKALELHIRSGYREGSVICTLGCPSYTVIRNWYNPQAAYL